MGMDALQIFSYQNQAAGGIWPVALVNGLDPSSALNLSLKESNDFM